MILQIFFKEIFEKFDQILIFDRNLIKVHGAWLAIKLQTNTLIFYLR